MPTQGTYYLDTSSFATATAIYTDAALTTAATNGWYKTSSNTFREQTGAPNNPVLSSTFTCECTTYSSAAVESTSTAACVATVNQTYFHNGSSSLPVVSDVCYSDAGQTVLGNGFYKLSNTNYIEITGGAGVVASVGAFATGTSFNSTTTQTNSTNACGATVNQTYYHNGSTGLPITTNACYTDACQSTALGNGYYRLAPANQNYTITVSNPGSGNKYYIDGVLQTTLVLTKGYTYTFNQSNSSNSSHPFRLSTTSDGTHGGGSQYTTGWTDNGGTAGSNLISTFVVPSNAPSTLYYYCQYHSGMGGQISIASGSSYMQITGGSGVIASITACPSALTAYSSSTGTVFNGVCPFDGSNPPANQTYYHDGSGTLPTAGDICYSDSGGTTTLGSFYYYLTGTGSNNRQYIQVDNNGEVLFGYPQLC